jgi:hypothetical protein
LQKIDALVATLRPQIPRDLSVVECPTRRPVRDETGVSNLICAYSALQAPDGYPKMIVDRTPWRHRRRGRLQRRLDDDRTLVSASGGVQSQPSKTIGLRRHVSLAAAVRHSIRSRRCRCTCSSRMSCCSRPVAGPTRRLSRHSSTHIAQLTRLAKGNDSSWPESWSLIGCTHAR